MKRDLYGLWRDASGRPVFDECVDWTDLGDKMCAMMNFATKACSSDYGDSFLVYFKGTSPEQPKKVVEMNWFCSKMSPPPITNKDERGHEALLCHHFKKWDLSIQKMPYRWEVIISTPSSPPKNDKAAKHCVEVCSCADSTTPPATATVSGSAV